MGGDGKGDDKGDGKGDGKDGCAQIADISKALKEFTTAKNLDKKAFYEFCTPLQNATKDMRALVQHCHPEALKKAVAICSGDGKGDGKGDDKGDGKGDDKEDGKGPCRLCDGKGDGKGDDKGDKSGAGGLRIRSPHATIELGGDVKLFRSGAKALTVDAAVNVQGSVSAKSVKIGGVPLDEYIRQKVKELLAKEKK